MRYPSILKIVSLLIIPLLFLAISAQAGYWQRQGEAYYLLKDAKNGGRSWCDMLSCSFNSISIKMTDLGGNFPPIYIDFKWDTPRNIIKPGDILDVHASFTRRNVWGSWVEMGSDLTIYMDLPKVNTGARVDFLGLGVYMGAGRGPSSGEATNTKIKAPEGTSGDREVRVRIDSFLEVAFPYKWVEGEPNPSDITHSPKETTEIPEEVNTIIGKWEIGSGGSIGSENERTIYYKGELIISAKPDGGYEGVLTFKAPGYGPEKQQDVEFDPDTGVLSFTRPGVPQYYTAILKEGGLVGTFTHGASIQYWHANR